MHDINKLLNTLECLFYVANRPLTNRELMDFFRLEEDLLKDLVTHLSARYENQGLRLEEVGGGFQVLTREEYAPFVEQFFTVKEKRKLSVAALETLSIIAYRQPVTRFEIEEVRGVNSDAVVNRLLELNLIKIAGRRETVGKPYEYATSSDFLHYFGLRDLGNLPPMDTGLASLLDQSLQAAEPPANPAHEISVGEPEPVAVDAVSATEETSQES